MDERGETFDLSGIPTYYVNKLVTRDMGDGHVMVICGMVVNELFTPLYTAVLPANVALSDGGKYMQVAQKAFCILQGMVGIAH